jgi:large subunit ribosomal protein L20
VPRVKRGTHRRASRKKVLELASGYFLTKSKLYRAAQEAVERALKFAYVGRKLKKREYRSLWIVRINASCRAAGVSYSQFIRGLKAAGLDLNRKVLADIALHDEAGFGSLIQAAKAALEDKANNAKGENDKAKVEPTVASEDLAAAEHEAVPEPTV